jgi:hypothetical protein
LLHVLAPSRNFWVSSVQHRRRPKLAEFLLDAFWMAAFRNMAAESLFSSSLGQAPSPPTGFASPSQGAAT